MLQAYYRHRFLEIAGRYDEIFVPEMTVENPVYHVHASGQHTKLEGQDAVKRSYEEVNSGQRSGRVLPPNHFLWRSACELQLTGPKYRPLSASILAQYSSHWN